MNKKEVEKIVDQFKFERYGRVDLPYGLHTKGLDRSSTRDLIFSESLKGKSVLDIGCAYGYLCFEAEKLGAKKIVGLETKKPRYDRANLFKKILNSNVEILQKNVIEYQFDQKFDYVIILNVLHHLKQNAAFVIEKLSNLTNEKLIIETPRLKYLEEPLDTLLQKYFKDIEIMPSLLEGPESGSRQIYICKNRI